MRLAGAPAPGARRHAAATGCLACALALGAPAVRAQTTPATRQLAARVCASCHGVDGNSRRASVPTLAGQYGDYLERQLHLFHDQGQRRASGVMGAIAVHLTDAQMHDLADYFSHQPLLPAQQPKLDDVARGASIWLDGLPDKGVTACAACHGVHARGLSEAYPRLAGQGADYVATQLREFHSGARASDAERLMRDLAAKLSDADMNAVARYVAALD
ncbi:MAG: c-type cytochrome [Betaproteobacteria bacterium]